MRILCTGATLRQRTPSPSSRALDRVHDMRCLVEALRLLGHEADHRATAVGENLSAYDAAVVGLAPLASLNSSGGILSALYAASQLPSVLFFEDWKIHHLRSSFAEAPLSFGERRFADGRLFYAETGPRDAELAAVARSIAAGTFPAAYLVPAFRWGSSDRIDLAHTVHRVDLTPFALNFCADVRPLPMNERFASWFYASLDSQRFPHLSWPVASFGSKAEKLPSEEAVFRRGSHYKGILSPTYPQDGSGWFRARFQYSAAAKNVLLCGPKDADALGFGPLNAAHIEAMNDGELSALATRQSEAILSYSTTREIEAKNLANALEEALCIQR